MVMLPGITYVRSDVFALLSHLKQPSDAPHKINKTWPTTCVPTTPRFGPLATLASRRMYFIRHQSAALGERVCAYGPDD